MLVVQPTEKEDKPLVHSYSDASSTTASASQLVGLQADPRMGLVTTCRMGLVLTLPDPSPKLW